ncbi:hypothetical protein RvY_07010-3 [Ramazzottius varieornatus]|nr:hypothetical protein RvY_07010-3 [Ramazzottius varieornatus]
MRSKFLPESFPKQLELILRIFTSGRRSCRRGLAGIFTLGALATYIMISVTLRLNPQRTLPFEEDGPDTDADDAPVQRWYLTNASMQHVSPVQQDEVWHLWPKMQPNSDRIENQLLYRPKKKPTRIKLILSTERGLERPGHGRSCFVKKKCLVNHCKITYDWTKSAEADAILFKNNAPSEIHYGSTRPPDQVWILSLLESPHHTSEFSRLYGRINWTAT